MTRNQHEMTKNKGKYFASWKICSNFAADLVRRGSKKRQHEACPPRGKTRFTNN